MFDCIVQEKYVGGGVEKCRGVGRGMGAGGVGKCTRR